MARRLLSIAAAVVSVLLLAHEADADFDVKRVAFDVKRIAGMHGPVTKKETLVAGTTKAKRTLLLAARTSPVQEAFYEQAVVDHNAAPTVLQFWKQRYFVNPQFWGGKGFPVFFLHGGETAFQTYRLDTGMHINDLAIKHKALLVGLEHRYYGKSVPTADLSTENLRFLSSEQQLADVARFHGFLTTTMGLETSKWVAFGGSYPGSLAAWGKLKYPALFAGAIASAAPLEAKSNFFEYNEIVGRSLRAVGGDECYDRIEQGVVAFRKLVDGGAATQSQLQQLFPMCSPIKDDWDLSIYEAGISSPIQNVVQTSDYSDPTIKAMCTHFSNQTQTPLALLSAFTLDSLSGHCIDSTFEGNARGLIEYLKRTVVDGDGYYRQWFYQTCNEFGWFQTTTSPNQPFFALKSQTEAAVGLEVCKRVFNMDAAPGIARTNAVYGGLNLTVENVTFSTGSIDPWSAVAVTNTTPLKTTSATALFIVGTTHVTETGSPSQSDIPALTAAYATIAANVAKYIGAQQ